MRQELLALVKDLPSLLCEIGAGASALSEAIELYQACVEFVCERWAWGHRDRPPHLLSPRVGWAGGGVPGCPQAGALPGGLWWGRGCWGVPALRLAPMSPWCCQL